MNAPLDWPAVSYNLEGLHLVRHAILTFNGTWGEGITQYPGDTVNGLNEFVDDTLVYEVNVQYPASFGPIGGSATAPGYQQSIQDAIDWTTQWLNAHPTQTFGMIGYSQGAEAASRVLIAMQSGNLQQFMPNFIGGITYGNPSRGAGFHAPTIADPGGRGISDVNMTVLPEINGQVVWADYVHSPANGDAGLDMYASVPTNQVGQDMTDVYMGATETQFNDPTLLAQDFVHDLMVDVQALLPNASQLASGAQLLDLLGRGIGAASGGDTLGLIGLLPELLAVTPTDFSGSPTGMVAALDAVINGIKFLAAPGGPTAPHISYLGEIAGYSNLVADGVGFLHQIATLTPARV